MKKPTWRARNRCFCAAGSAALLAALAGCPKRNDRNARTGREAKSEQIVEDMDKYAEAPASDPAKENTGKDDVPGEVKKESDGDPTGRAEGEKVDPKGGGD